MNNNITHSALFSKATAKISSLSLIFPQAKYFNLLPFELRECPVFKVETNLLHKIIVKIQIMHNAKSHCK